LVKRKLEKDTDWGWESPLLNVYFKINSRDAIALRTSSEAHSSLKFKDDATRTSTRFFIIPKEFVIND